MIKGMIDGIEKYPVLLAGFCYVVGLIVVTTYLNQYGVAMPVSLFRVNYLLAGAWALLPLVAVSIVLSYIRLLIEMSKPSSIWLRFIPSLIKFDGLDTYRSKTLKVALYVIGFAIGGVVILLLYLFQINMLHPDWIRVIWNAAIIVWMLSMIRRLINWELGQPPNFIVYTITFATAFLFLSSIIRFGVVGYQHIPANIGGGHPMSVRLSIKPGSDADSNPKNGNDNTKMIKGMGIPIKDGNIITDPCKLIYTTDDEYIILVGPDGKEHAVTIRRDIINGVIYSNLPQK